MILMRKKDIFKELALSLFMMLNFAPDTTALSVIQRIRDKAEAALRAASAYTGTFCQKDAQEFLESQPYNFTISCDSDIVNGDIIQFIETVFDNRRKPPRHLGKRSVTAEVMEMHAKDESTMLHLRVICSGGVWDLKPETLIRRSMKNIARFEIKRVAWQDEAKRLEAKKNMESPQETKAADQPLGRYSILKTTRA